MDVGAVLETAIESLSMKSTGKLLKFGFCVFFLNALYVAKNMTNATSTYASIWAARRRPTNIHGIATLSLASSGQCAPSALRVHFVTSEHVFIMLFAAKYCELLICDCDQRAADCFARYAYPDGKRPGCPTDGFFQRTLQRVWATVGR